MITTFPGVDLYGEVARSELLPGTNRTCETNSGSTLRSPGGLPSKLGHARPPASTRPQAIQESAAHYSCSEREHACNENKTSAWSVRPVPTGLGVQRLATYGKLKMEELLQAYGVMRGALRCWMPSNTAEFCGQSSLESDQGY